MIEKQIVRDEIKIKKDGVIEVTTKTIFVEDGIKVYDGNTTMKIINPGDNADTEEADVQSIVALFHTVETIASYEEIKRQRELGYEV